MSVVAGCSLFDGVILLADCRATICWPQKPKVYVDNVQKIFPISPYTALGFVGDIIIASKVIESVYKCIPTCKSPYRYHPIKLLEWFPRFFRYKYKAECKNNTSSVVFMVASVIPDRPNIIKRSKVVMLMERFRKNELSRQRNWLPQLLVDILRAPTENIILPDFPYGLIYEMKSPDFIPRFINPLEYSAIGSGEGAQKTIDRDADWIFASDIGNTFIESMGLRDAVSSFIESEQIEDVGGLYPCIKINKKGLEMVGQKAVIPVGGTEIELAVNSNMQWVQRNRNLGKEVKIQLPWEIDFSQYHSNVIFNDLKETMDQFRAGDCLIKS